MKIINTIKRLFITHCPYCKSFDLEFINYVSSDIRTGYWWDMKDCNVIGSFRQKLVKCKKCGLTHITP